MRTLKGKMLFLAAVAAVMTFVAGIAGVIGMYLINAYVEQGVAETHEHSEAMLHLGRAQFAYKNQIQDFKNLQIRGNDPARYEQYARSFAKYGKEVEAELKSTREHAVSSHMDASVVTKIDAAQAAFQTMVENYGSAIKKFDIQDPQAGKVIDKLVSGKDRETSKLMVELQDLIDKGMEDQFVELKAGVVQTYATTRNIVILLVLVGLAALLAVSTWITRSVLGTLGGEPAVAAEIVGRIAEGDLTRSSQFVNAPAGSMLAAIERMRDNLQAIVTRIHASSEELAQSSHELSAQSAAVADSNSRQGEAVASMAAAMEQMATSIAQVADNANDAQRNASEAGRLSSEGTGVIRAATDEMRAIAETVQQATVQIQSLEEQSSKISAIVSVIREIADQTNLLALNAAIEAARAGEQGRGFAVVADEVRKLAERTTQSTQEITRMIDEIQQRTGNVMEVMSSGVERVNTSVASVQAAGDSMARIRESAMGVISAFNEISVALKEQSEASEQISRSVENVASRNEENSVAVHHLTDAAHQLNTVAADLRQAVERFKV